MLHGPVSCSVPIRPSSTFAVEHRDGSTAIYVEDSEDKSALDCCLYLRGATPRQLQQLGEALIEQACLLGQERMLVGPPARA